VFFIHPMLKVKNHIINLHFQYLNELDLTIIMAISIHFRF